MSRVQVAVFPAILVGIFLIVAATSLIQKPIVVQAGSDFSAQQGELAQSNSGGQPDVVNDANQLAKEGTAGTGGGENFIGENTPVPYVEPVYSSPNVEAQTESRSEVPDGCSLSDRYAASVLQWCDLIEKYATENGLEAGLVAALITQESGGDPNAYSHSGAVGLMQVMPSDGIASNFMCASGPCFTNRPTTQELQDPEYNISYGTRMLAGLLNKYGNIRDALLYYGPINVGYYYADLVLGIFNSHQ